MFTNHKEEIVMIAQELDEEKDKDTHMKEYIKSIKALEDAMEPYKEQKRELRKEYADNGWLNKDEQRLIIKAYRLLKEDIDIGQLIDMYEALKDGS